MSTQENTANTTKTTKPIERKAFVLLSGGLDSTTCLYKAIYDFGLDTEEEIRTRISQNIEWVDEGEINEHFDPITWVEAISVYYGQRHQKEMQYAQSTCAQLGIQHSILDIGKVLAGAKVMLTEDSRGQVEVPNISYDDIKGV